ncbi:MAG: DUF962 domain-containing protein [Deltaproteobacteria bacterium]|nr:DUF962 domain-containing protein [Deltaproteobacteria bacterium]
MSLQSMIENYKKVHRHPVNHAFHAVGIPMILLSLVWVFFNWKIGILLFFVGWACQFAGHAVEGTTPAFFSNPTYLIIGPIWLFKKVQAALSRNHEKRDPGTSQRTQPR